MGVLQGKTVVVTGASSGSGAGITRSFLAAGATVVMLARGRERLMDCAAACGNLAVPIVADVGTPESVEAAFAEIRRRFGVVDVLVNNAGIYAPCAVENLTDEEIGRTLATNLLGPVHTSRAAIPLLRAAGGGDIINTSSESTLRPFPMLSLYVATKAGLEAFGKVLAMEVAVDDIRVTTVIQGTATGASGSSTDWGWHPDHGAAALELWAGMGLLDDALGRHGGQDVDAIGDLHVFIATRPRTQKLETVHCRSF